MTHIETNVLKAVLTTLVLVFFSRFSFDAAVLIGIIIYLLPMARKK